MKTREKKDISFEDRMHVSGRLWTGGALLLMLCVPLFIGIYFGTGPNLTGLLIGTGGICLIYLPSSLVEVATYAPMLGTGATYLAFVTGNLSNLKIPCCMNARDTAGTEYGTKENEIVSTLSVAASAITTCAVLAIGVLLLAPLTPVLNSPVLQPAFDNVVPALFGALGFKYFSKAPKVAIAPVIAMVALCIFVPAAASQVAILVPVAALISIAFARLLYKKNML